MTSFRNIPKIDVHSHFLTKSYLDAMQKYLGGNPDRFPMPEWSVERHLAYNEAMGIDHTVLSYSSPHINFSTREVNRELARIGNEEAAAIVAKNSGKFSYLASLPLPNLDDSLAEIAHAHDHLGADGFTLPTNTKGTYMGAPELEPMFAEFNRRKALVTFHPNKPGAVPAGVGEMLPIPMMEFVFDTTRCVVDLMLRNYPEKYPDIKFLMPHCGSMLPYVVDRIASFKPTLIKTGSVKPDYDVAKVFSSFYFDTTGASAAHQLRDVMDMTDISHILYGSDFPFPPVSVLEEQTDAVFNAPYLNAEQKACIFYKNALALFPKAKF